MFRQQIRPVLEDLPDPAGSDEDRVSSEGEEGEGEGVGEDGPGTQLRSLHGGADVDEGGEPTYEPAARAFRDVAPPIIGKAGESGQIEKERRRPKESTRALRRDVDEAPQERGSAMKEKTVRIDLAASLAGATQGADDSAEEEGPGGSAGSGGGAPLIGTIQERRGISRSEAESSEKKKMSRFAQKRQLERERQGATAVPAGGGGDEGDVWLDEDGKPMSAFRRKMLEKRGGVPPSRTKPTLPSSTVGQSASAVSKGATGAADPMLAEISKENEEKVAKMSREEVEAELKEIGDSLGPGVLDLLMARSRGSSQKEEADKQELLGRAEERVEKVDKGRRIGQQSTTVVQKQPGEKSNNRVRFQDAQGEDTPEEIRKRFFPEEPATVPASLQWTQDDARDAVSRGGRRFGFDGRPIDDEVLPTDESRLSGLHHHGEEQDKAGYTVEELLHLARSTNRSQRTIALRTLGHVIFQSSLQRDNEIHCEIRGANAFARALRLASWNFEDRHMSVRSVAWFCADKCITNGLCERTGSIVQDSLDKPSKEEQRDALEVFDVIKTVMSVIASPAGTPLSAPELSHALSILVNVTTRSRKMAVAVASHKGLVDAVISAAIRQRQWPLAKGAKGDAAPDAAALRLLLNLVRADREVAHALVTTGQIEALLRFLAVLPSDHHQPSLNLLNLTLEIYTCLSRYGMCADLASKVPSIVASLLQWVASPSSSFSSDAYTRALALDLLSIWIVCAQDPHQTVNHHDIRWVQVAEWWEVGRDVIRLSASTSAASRGQWTVDTFLLVASAAQLLDEWLIAAQKYDDAACKTTIATVTENLWPTICQASTFFGDRCSQLRKSEEMATGAKALPGLVAEEELSDMREIARSARGAHFIFRLAKRIQRGADLAMHATVHTLLRDNRLWSALIRDDVDVPDLARHLTSFCADVIFDGTQSTGDKPPETEAQETGIQLLLALLYRLGQGDEKIARYIIGEALPRVDPSLQDAIHAIRPFWFESLRVDPKLEMAPRQTISSQLLRTNTLLVPHSTKRYELLDAHQERTGDDEEEETDEKDPLSGAPLWKSPIRGLPLRKDWPMMALDDLLHSGTCASLNRMDALPADWGWDVNERGIVQASVKLATSIFAQSPSISFSTDRLGKLSQPTVADVYLGIVKVFLLEADADKNDGAASSTDKASSVGKPKPTGLLTGRDLFRDPQISTYLFALFEHFVPSPTSYFFGEGGTIEEIEETCKAQWPSSNSFYQLYTDLLGLYDSASFGDDNFARTILLPALLEPRQGEDRERPYSRLLLNDYRHVLKSVGLKCGDGVEGRYVEPLAYWVSGKSRERKGQDEDDGLSAEEEDKTKSKDGIEEDREVVRAMVSILVESFTKGPNAIDETRNELMWQWALRSVAHHVWKVRDKGAGDDDEEAREARQILKTLWPLANRQFKDTFCSVGLETETKGEDTSLAERLAWISTVEKSP
ncbi:hypothetical protein FA10DRAFT_164258 [Acaromyces ingoldii]|uniref:RNA polymerase II-associated protein 1 C-terminal domain-containing protein n=1 Tax=Acaromyces ingoldii TaxID=215250 RepID=A0A316YH03_9BASI|nr:hypothetical protein FA10DRAFT_164258 [Acaromyces ingoldii]PWN88479.1 hypothetical protein FA10DRAFT_164258 [Acaromyces ingoldii]